MAEFLNKQMEAKQVSIYEYDEEKAYATGKRQGREAEVGREEDEKKDDTRREEGKLKENYELLRMQIQKKLVKGKSVLDFRGT